MKMTRVQTETILGRKLSNPEWTILSKDYKVPIAKAAKNRIPQQLPHQHYKEVYKKAASEAAKTAHRKEIKRLNEAEINYDGIEKLFKLAKSDYKITKISQYYSDKFRSEVSNWYITGTADIFQINLVIADLVNKMTEDLSDNVKLQVSLSNTKNDKVNQSKLLGKQETIYKLSDWVNLFIDYADMEIGDINFKLLAIKLPTGAGIVNLIQKLN